MARTILLKLAYILFLVLNRPSLLWFGRFLYDFALRCNGIAINFRGQFGVTVGEEHFIRRIHKHLAHGIVLDIGANVGAYSKAVRRLAPDAIVYAFEPHPKTFQRLSASAAEFGFHAEALALGEKRGVTEIFDFEERDGSSLASLNADVVGFYRDVSKYAEGTIVSYSVECTTITDFLKDHEIDRVSLVKIDTEGLDIKVLRGARKILIEGRVDVIQFEFISGNVAARVFMKDFFDLLHNYDIYRLCLNGDLALLQPYDPRRCEIFCAQNIIAVLCGKSISGLS